MGPGNPQNGYGFDPRMGYPSQQPTNGMSFQNFANQNTQQPRPNEKFLVCKFIDDPTRIMPIDVPSNGDPAFFVARDFSCIYARAVNSQGTIDNVVYAPVRQESPEDIQKAKDDEFRSMVMQNFANIQNMLSALTVTPSAEDTQDKPKSTNKGGKANA